MANIPKRNRKAKGWIAGSLFLFALEFGTIAVLAGFSTDGIWHYERSVYYSVLGFNALIAVSLGFAIGKQLKITKFLLILNILACISVLAGYSFFFMA